MALSVGVAMLTPLLCTLALAQSPGAIETEKVYSLLQEKLSKAQSMKFEMTSLDDGKTVRHSFRMLRPNCVEWITESETEVHANSSGVWTYSRSKNTYQRMPQTISALEMITHVLPAFAIEAGSMFSWTTSGK